MKYPLKDQDSYEDDELNLEVNNDKTINEDSRDKKSW